MNQTLLETIIVIVGIVSVVSMAGLHYVGMKAYTSGSAPGAPEAFTSFASQLLRLATVIAIVSTVLTLTLFQIKLDSAVTGILSGIAGYVLGGAERNSRLRAGQSPDKEQDHKANWE